MKKNLLIIRSVSFQQLDLNLPEIQKAFPNYNISILTHAHGEKLAKKYSFIKKVYIYEYEGAFNKKNKVKSLSDTEWDAVLVPVTNISGESFLNVLAFGTSIKAKKYFMCNVVSEITELSSKKIFLKKARGLLCKTAACILTVPAALLGALVLLVVRVFRSI